MTLGPDLQLDPETHDLLFGPDGDLVMATNVGQHIKIRLLFFEGEWFLDAGLGTPYFRDILKKAPNLSHVTAVFRQRIIETPGVIELTELELDYDNPTRKLSVRFKAETTTGSANDVVEIQV